MTAKQQQILDALRAAGRPLCDECLAARMGRTPAALRAACQRLAAQGVLVRESTRTCRECRGVWRAVSRPAHAHRGDAVASPDG